MDGQLDFLGLISEYTDDQGAKVTIREPGVRRSKPIPPPEPEQLSFDFTDFDKKIEEEARAKEQARKEAIRQAEEAKKARAEAEKAEAEAKEKAEAEKAEAEAKAKAEAERAEAEARAKAEAERAEAEARAKAEAEKAEAEARAKAEAEAKKAKEALKKEVKPIPKKAKESGDTPKDSLFKACVRCWCFDCKHNLRNEGVPRDICGTMMACPACKGCEEEDSPTICEIGNAKEGCMTRAIEEGIAVREEYIE